ncbi:MAG: FAD-dependent oxidoreductase, partial [Proteobacteria bacterium]|nr:FAD-dependent oxidoreductase [Pseudomonadota bacterium]NIS61319.1 FAD-dependent oxidoreductase [Pseudomonadota bacterium]
VMPALGTMFGTEYGGITQRYIDFLVERARGGVGLIITGNCCVDWPRGKVGGNPFRLDEEKFISGFNELAESVKFHGATIAVQLQFSGRLTSLSATEGLHPVAPSETPPSPGGERPHTLSPEEIHEIIRKFAKAALLAKHAGIDAVELHGAHGYLIGQFLSPFTNKRTDAYGGSREARARFGVELVMAVRAAVGSGYPIIYRMSADERIEGGLELNESQWFASRLEEAGVDAFHVTSGIYESRRWMFPGVGMEHGCNVSLAGGIKEAVSVPVIAVGKINDPLMAEEILQQGQADMVAMGRALIADPELPNKAKEGRMDEIRPCIFCNECIGRLYENWRVRCSVNPYVSEEGKPKAPPPEKKKRVLIIGGGPAGLMAANVAASRGHEVVLCEKNPDLGGRLHPASQPAFKTDIKPFINYLVRLTVKTGVTVEAKTCVTDEWLKGRRFDAIIVATGALAASPKFVNNSGRELFSPEEVLMDQLAMGERVAVIGAGRVGCEVAEFLAEQGKKVTIAEMLGEVAPDLHILGRERIIQRFEELGVRVWTGFKVSKFTPQGLLLEDKTSKEHLIEVDSVVFAGGYIPDAKSVRMVQGIAPEVYAVGDCKEPRKILDAVAEGSYIGSML